MLIGHSKYFFQLAALLLGCLFVLTGCENDPGEVERLYTKKKGVEEAKEIESYLSQDGYVKARLTAPFMLRYQADSPYIEFPRTMHVDFFDSTGKKESYLDAKYGKYFEYDRKVLLRDSVLVINMKNGDTLRTQKLWWDQNKSEFTTDVIAYIFQPDKVIVAKDGLQAAQNLTNIRFFNSSGILAVPKSDSTGPMPTDSFPPVPADPVQPPPKTLPNKDTGGRRSGSLIPSIPRDSLKNRYSPVLRQRQ